MLYSPASIGIEDYTKNRQKYDLKDDYFDKFQEKMKDYCSGNDPTSMIFTEDLKQFIHVTSGSDEQLSLAVQMMEKYDVYYSKILRYKSVNYCRLNLNSVFSRFHQQNAQLRFGSYHFGPVVMRMYYLFNKPDEALQVRIFFILFKLTRS